MTDESPARDPVAGNGLRALLPALVAASILGYLVQFVIPLTTSPETYVQVSAFWGLLFLGIAAFSGVQHEVARSAASPKGESRPGTLVRFGLVVVVVAALAAVCGGVVLSIVVPTGQPVTVVLCLVIALAGYALLAVTAGTLYGARRWRTAALAAVADPALRAVTIVIVALAAFGATTQLGLGPLLLAITVPFPIAFLVVFWAARRRRAPITVDADVRGLLRAASHTTLAATSMGLLISGLPLVVGYLGRDEPPAAVAGVIFLVVLARAPLVSPLLALQSYLTVRFSEAGEGLLGVVLRFLGIVAALTVFAATAAVLLAPVVFSWFVPSYELPPPYLTAVIVASAGLVAMQCVTGPAVLSRGRHRAYSAGWMLTALLVLGSALLPIPFIVGLIAALCMGPVVGLAAHLWVLARGTGTRRTPSVD